MAAVVGVRAGLRAAPLQFPGGCRGLDGSGPPHHLRLDPLPGRALPRMRATPPGLRDRGMGSRNPGVWAYCCC
nr:MAG TPA: hypothetical protein [Caudoviricetes sp.]